MGLLDYMRKNAFWQKTPLAVRIRPQSLEEVAGQARILGKDKLLHQAVKADIVGSMTPYGPPSCGKTTITEVIPRKTQSDFCRLDATMAGKEETEEVIQRAKENFERSRQTMSFVDGVHRFRKGQRGFLFPYVEDGTIALTGATVKNPFFEANAALLSYFRILELKPLVAVDIAALLHRATADKECGYGNWSAVLTEEVCAFPAGAVAGDARTALNAFELDVETTAPEGDGCISTMFSAAEDCIQKCVIRYDKDGDNHYNTVSAFIKSMQGSDPDTAVYHLARMLYTDEDPRSLARCTVICTVEDVGNADPMVLVVAGSMAAALDRIDVPEGRLLLSQTCLHIASAPKSNTATTTIFSALDFAAQTTAAMILPCPRSAHYAGYEKLGRSVGHRHPHDYPGDYVVQDYLPETLHGTVSYAPSNNGKEAEIKARLATLRAVGEEKHGGRKT